MRTLNDVNTTSDLPPVRDARVAKEQERGRPRSREKTRDELQLAMLRVKNKGEKLSITAVAAEAGVTPALIHNTYPDIAEAIRTQVGKAIRQQRDDKHAELVQARAQIKALRAELAAAEADIKLLASANETLRQENASLRSSAAGKVILLPARGVQNR